MNELAKPVDLGDERMIRDGEQAVDRYNKHQQHARAEILPMARGLCAARRKYPANKDFSDWLHISPYREMNDPERAALINIGHHEAFAQKFIPTTHYATPRTIWDAMQLLLPSLQPVKTTTERDQSDEPAETAAQTAENENASAAEASEQQRQAESESEQSSPTLDRRSPLFGLKYPRVQEIAAVFSHVDTRTAIGKAAHGRGGKAVWDLLLTALDAGLLTPNNRGLRTLTLAVLFPLATRGYVSRFDLSNQSQRKEVATVILPAMIACKDKLFADPGNLEQIVSDYLKGQNDKAKATAERQRVAEVMKGLSPDQQELRMFGKLLWPRVDQGQGEYDYDQIRCAIWTFHDLDNWNQMVAGDNSIGSRAIRIRLSMKWLSEYLLRNGRDNPMRIVFRLVVHLSRLMEQNPQGECKPPVYPLKEAEW